MQSVAGDAFAPLLGLHPAQGAAVGLVAVVASASNTPVAAIFMGVELFGGSSTLYVAGACVAAYLMMGHRSVYPAQQVAYAKSNWIIAPAGLPAGDEKVRLSFGLRRWWREVALDLWRRRGGGKGGSGNPGDTGRNPGLTDTLPAPAGLVACTGANTPGAAGSGADGGAVGNSAALPDEYRNGYGDNGGQGGAE